MTPTYKELCLFSCDVARATGKFMAEERKTFDSSKIETKGLHDLVSYVDKESEKRIIAALQVNAFLLCRAQKSEICNPGIQSLFQLTIPG